MTDFRRPENEQDFQRNFSQIKPAMNDTEAHYESSRCLFCYDAPCVNACPTGIDIPLFIRQIHTGDKANAAKTIYNSNWFGHACGKVCPTEILCEGACVYNHQDIKPIEIGRLQAHATSRVIANRTNLFVMAQVNGKKAAIIGAGPAGISCACELRIHGYEVVVFEAKKRPSGLTMHGVAPYKITNEEVLDEVEYLRSQFGFTIQYEKSIVSAKDFVQIESQYDAIFLGIGLGKTNMIPVPGTDKRGCMGATEFIEELRLNHHRVTVEGTVVVIGGGNTAMDAASESARLGASAVFLVYRGSKDEMPAYEFEYDLAKSVGVKGVFHAKPLEILGGENVEGVLFLEEGAEEFVIPCQTVILATGQEKQKQLLSEISGLQFDDSGRILANENYQCSNPKYFAGGDALNGGAEVVNAAAEGKKAARGMHEWLEKAVLSRGS